MVIGSHVRPRFDFARESSVIFSSELRKMRLQQGQHQRIESRLLLETPIAMTRDANFTLQKRFKHSDSTQIARSTGAFVSPVPCCQHWTPKAPGINNHTTMKNERA